MVEREPTAAASVAIFRQYLTAFLANLSAFNIGTMLGWTSPMQPLLTSNNPPVGSEPMSTELISWVGSTNYIGGLCGAIYWGIFSDRFGRKFTAIVVAIPFIISWVMKIVAPNPWWLLVARFIIGIGSSGVLINNPIYIAEIAQTEIRGSLGSFMITFVNAGCVFAYVVGLSTSYHALATICLCIPIIFLITFPNLPESPVSLWNLGKGAEAEKSLMWFRGGNESQTKEEIELLKSQSAKPFEEPSLRDLFISKGVRKALLISTFMILGQIFCGVLAILTYTFKIFQDSGSSLSAHSSTIAVGLLQLVSSFASSFLVDRAGRRGLLITSFIAMSASLITLASYSYFQKDSWPPFLRWIPVVCISVFVVFYSMGAGPVPFIVMSEIFPREVRGFAISKIQLLGSLFSFVSVKTFPLTINLLGSHGCFLFYALICAVIAVLTYATLPETKGKTLQTILKQLNGEDVYGDENEYSELFMVKKPMIVKK